MRTLKITLVVTVAVMAAWWFRLPYGIWPSHPELTEFLLALVLCVVLQFTWADSKATTKVEKRKS